MINLNSILATFPKWGQKVPPLSLFGGEKRHQNDKMGAKAPPHIINKAIFGCVHNYA